MAKSARNPIKCKFEIPANLSPNDPEGIRAAAEFAYVWGWTLVNVATRAKRMKQVLRLFNKKHLKVEGWPIGYNSFTLQTEPSSTKERLMCCPNTSLRYGGGAFRLGTKGAIAQVPQGLCDDARFWLYSLYDARSHQFGACGTQDKSEPGFYLIVGPDWDQRNPDPDQIPNTHVIRCCTELAYLTARIFLKDPKKQPPWLKSVNFYPVEEYQPGVYQSVDWENVENIRLLGPPQDEELSYVNWRTFFTKEFPKVLKAVEPRDGEDEIYRRLRKLLDLAAHSRKVRHICRSVARETEDTIIESYMLWSKNGKEAGNRWYTSVNSGQWEIDEYCWRTATAKSNLFENRPVYTRYYYTDTDSAKMPLDGTNTYSITFDGGLPPAQGPSSVTVYNQHHFLIARPFSFSINDLPRKFRGPLVVYAGPTPPRRGCNFIRTSPNEPFCLYLRAYYMDESTLPTLWMPPKIEKCKSVKAV